MRFSASLPALAAFAATAIAQSIPFSSHCETVPGGQLCYAVNVPSDSSDSLYISITGPSTTGYAGLGFGNVMAGSLFFIALPTADNNVTVSVRTTGGEYMPTAYLSSPISVEILPGTMNSGSSFLVNFQCTGCRSWSTGTLDTTSTSAGFIWSTGRLANGAVATDPNANILYHGNNNGNFNLNLQLASGTGGIPNSNSAGTSAVASVAGASAASTATGAAAAPTSSTTASTGGFGNVGSTETATRGIDRESLWWSHATFMTVGWILIIGTGATIIRFFPTYIPAGKAVRVHYCLQLLGAAFVIIGAGLGIAGSTTHFMYAHQTLGVVIFAIMFLQIALGALHHLNHIRSAKSSAVSSTTTVTGRTAPMALVHRYLGRSLIVAAMVNAGLAFRLPMVRLGKGSQIAWYVIMGLLVLAYTIANISLEVKKGRIPGAKVRSEGRDGREKSLPESSSGSSH